MDSNLKKIRQLARPKGEDRGVVGLWSIGKFGHRKTLLIKEKGLSGGYSLFKIMGGDIVKLLS